MKNICFYDVDTQKDFMDKNGALYVPNAETIKPNLRKLTDYAVSRDIPVWGSVDKHYANDNEFKVFPPHCVAGTEGRHKIFQTDCLDTSYIENKAYSANELKWLMSSSSVHFEKQEVSVFSNANANLLKRFDAAVVYGVATEYCVKAAVLGMRQRGIDVLVVEDAIKGINPEGEFYAIEEMKAAGAKFIKTSDVLEDKIRQILWEMWK